MKKIQLIHAGTFYQGVISSVEHGKEYYAMSIRLDDGQIMEIVGKGGIETGRVNDRTFIVRLWDESVVQAPLKQMAFDYIKCTQ